MSVSLPHFAAFFTLGNDGKPIVVEQDSAEDIGACVTNLAVCVQGAKLNDPTFGIPSPLFKPLPLDPTGIVDAINAQEPRANVTAT